MIAAQCLGQLMAPFTVEGSCNRTIFEIWLETCLIPLLSPGQVVVMDNATFHKGGRIEQLIQAAGSLVAVHKQLIHRTSIGLSDAGLGSKAGFVSNLTSLIVYAMRWSMSYI
jgi:transposase